METRLLLLKLLLLLLLLLQGILPLRSAQEEEEEEEAAGAVRLCGRDFIRAIIFTCGGSRWKRILSSPPDQPQRTPSDFVQVSGNKGLEDNNLLSVLDPMLEQLRSGSKPAEQQLPKDLFNLYDDYIASVPASDNFNQYRDAARKRGGEIGLANSKGLNSFPWVKYPRRKRNSPATVSEICCKFGCTQKHLSKIC
ncbi:hypothetical protein JD844_009268 [Phrynosoma platyrhinos]|uniref:Insulin-like domain-containing protein n=1 Tax=Phrynosoma platyrhinos TaxID=52577 RepID=A0ABQ7TFQ8_PHRPL|nr:hypothetical protein JD844_009268 [Phrynosoma platyrhinos]